VTEQIGDHLRVRAVASKLSCQAVAEIVPAAQLDPQFLRSRFEETTADIVRVKGRPISGGNFVDAKLLLKIHGCVTKDLPEDSIVITEEDYYRFLRQDRYMINKLYTLCCERTVVFLGYSLSDPNIQFIYHDFLFDHQTHSGNDKAGVSSRFSNIRLAFFITNKKPPEDQRIYFRQKRIMYVECEIEQFFKNCSKRTQQAYNSERI